MRVPTYREVICEALASIFVGLFIGTVLAVIVSHITGCAHVFPNKCQPGEHIQDADRRVWNGINDCYKCDDGVPGRVNVAGHYICPDYTCNQCSAPIDPFEPHDPLKPLEDRRRTDGGAP